MFPTHIFITVAEVFLTGVAVTVDCSLRIKLSEEQRREQVVVGTSEMWGRHQSQTAHSALCGQLAVLATTLRTQISSTLQFAGI